MIEFYEALSLLMAAIQMGCMAFLAAAVPVWAVEALSE